jgi:shikimate dehydrogenase
MCPSAPADAAGFEALVAAGRAGLLMRLNVTAPFKEQALALADSVSPEAGRAGSANVLVFRDGHVACDSTDGFGMMWALADQAPGLSVKGPPVVLLGAGGAARAAAGTLIAEGAEVRVVNRSHDGPRPWPPIWAWRSSVADEAKLSTARSWSSTALSIPPTIDLARLRSRRAVMDMTYRPVTPDF